MGSGLICWVNSGADWPQQLGSSKSLKLLLEFSEMGSGLICWVNSGADWPQQLGSSKSCWVNSGADWPLDLCESQQRLSLLLDFDFALLDFERSLTLLLP